MLAHGVRARAHGTPRRECARLRREAAYPGVPVAAPNVARCRVVRASPTVGVIGASGYTGVELTRLLARHPGVQLAMASSDRWIGDTVEQHGAGASSLRYIAPDDAPGRARQLATVFLATPAEVSHDLAAQLVGRGPCVIDLSGAFRLRDTAAFAASYGFQHRHAELLAHAVYGLPELSRARITDAQLIANPGCYATAIALALAPIVPLLAPGRIAVDAGSGLSGAGRSADEAKSFVAIYGDVRAYRVLRHQHAPEIEQTIGARVAFVPHLLPIARGILATCHASLAPGITADAITAAYVRAYADEPFVALARSADDVALRAVVGTNRCQLGFAVDGDHVVVIAAIDNLVKGAAGQAVQNMNIRLGLDETAGLADLAPHHP